MAKKERKVIVKKVSPYPIKCKMQPMEGPEMTGYILKLTPSGFLVEVRELSVKVGKSYETQFTLPVSTRSFSEKVRVVKTYDRIHTSIPGDTIPVDENVKQAKKQAEKENTESQRKLFRLAEVHFLGIGMEEKKWIRDFMMKIQQLPESS